MALSVDEQYRKNGVGDVLFHRGLLHCESLGIKKIYMNCLASNTPIQKLARRHGMKVTTDYGESVAALNLTDRNAIVAFLESVQNDTMGLYDVNLRSATARWTEYIRLLTQIASNSAGLARNMEQKMSAVVNMSLSTVMTLQQQLQKVQIARDCAQNLLAQFITYGEQVESQERLRIAIKQLKLVEVDVCTTLGFTEAVDKLRGSL